MLFVHGFEGKCNMKGHKEEKNADYTCTQRCRYRPPFLFFHLAVHLHVTLFTFTERKRCILDSGSRPTY